MSLFSQLLALALTIKYNHQEKTHNIKPKTLVLVIKTQTQSEMKKRPERRKHCALAVVGGAKKFRPAVSHPIPGGAPPPKFNQLEMVITVTYQPSLVKIDAHNFELSW